MKTQFKTFLIVGTAALLSACGQQEPSNESEKEDLGIQEQQGSPWISEVVGPEEFRSHFKDENAVIVDVRTPEEIAEGIIPNAIHIDYNGPDFESRLRELDLENPVLVYCAGGGRSGKTRSLLTDIGFYTVYDLDGGIGAWRSEGMELVMPGADTN